MDHFEWVNLLRSRSGFRGAGKVFRIKKGATPGEGAAPDETREEAGYFFFGIFAALSVGVVFTALSVGADFFS